MMDTYRIVRYHFKGRHEIIKTGLTLAEAQEHCRKPETREDGKWFDGYEKE